MDNFSKEVLKLNEHRNFKITNSLGVYDAYRWIRRNKYFGITPFKDSLFYKVIREVNKALIEDFLSTGIIEFPCKMGKLELRRYNIRLKLKDGKINTNLPINWKETLKLWSEDKESFNNKTLLRQTNLKCLYKIFYIKNKACYNNKTFYAFKINRGFKNSVVNKLINGKLDAFEI